MYLDHYGLLEPPFSIAPDPRYLYMSERHREALAHLLYGMESDGAFILLTGDVGTGKTTVSRCLLEQVPNDTNLALVLNPKLTSVELLQVICDELRISYEKTNQSVKLLVDYINRYLLGAHAQGKKTVVLIEEAQNLDLDVLEQLRLLTNLETNERKLLQVILLGQPEFLDVLDRLELSQLAQRITARFHLGPLKLREVEEYVAHRLAVAGCRRPLFSHAVIKQLFHYSGGVPRLINVICDRALLGCYVQNKHHVEKVTLINAAREVLGENKANTIGRKNKPVYLVPAILLALVFMLVIGVYFYSNDLKKLIHDGALSDEVVETIKVKKLEVNSVVKKPLEIKRKTVTEIKSPSSEVEKIIEEVQPVVSDSETLVNIKWPDRNQRLRSNLQAYQNLFNSWNIKYNILTDGTPCFYAKTQGLYCRHEASGIDMLRQLNRPAVLTLYDDLNQRQYVTLTKIKGKEATIIMAEREQRIPLEQLLFYWHGEFSLLWRKPPGFDRVIKPGHSGESVLWLSERMNEVGAGPKLKARSYYDSELLERVKKFQQQQGLKNDGVVGLKTLIQINQTGLNKAPQLESS